MDRTSPATRANPVERDKLFSQLYRYRTDPASRAENWRVSRENFAGKFEIVKNQLKLWSLYSSNMLPRLGQVCLLLMQFYGIIFVYFYALQQF